MDRDATTGTASRSDPLRVLLTIQQRAVDQARQDLVGCQRQENEAAEAIAALDQTLEQERAVAEPTQSNMNGMAMFTAWLAQMRTRRHAAVATRAEAELRTTQARAVLASARTAAQATEQLLEAREAARRAAIESREAHALDDIARARHRARALEEAEILDGDQAEIPSETKK